MEVSFEFAFDNPKHSDYTLVLKSHGVIHKTIYVSNVILSSYSTYFVALFTNNMKETHQKEVEIELDHYESALFYCIIRSLYTGKLVLPSLSELNFELEHPQPQVSENEKMRDVEGEENGQKEKDEDEDKKGKKRKVDDGDSDEKEEEDMIEGEKSDKNKENEKKEEGEEEFGVNIEESNKVRVCVDMIKLLDRFSIQRRFSQCVDLLKEGAIPMKSACFRLSILDESFDHILSIKDYKQSLVDFLVNECYDFDKTWLENEFLLLPDVIIQRVLQSDDLLVSCEETMLQALRRWVNHSPKERVPHLSHLLPLVRFTQMDLIYLTENVLGYDNFFEHCEEEKNAFKMFQSLVIKAVRCLSFAYVQQRKLANLHYLLLNHWWRNRSGYKAEETSENILWECDVDKESQVSNPVYFRGIFHQFHLQQLDKKLYFMVQTDKLMTCGQIDHRQPTVNIICTVSAFNYRNQSYNNLTQDTFFYGGKTGEPIDTKLELDQESSPYFKPSEKPKRIICLRVCLKKKG